MSAAVPIIVPLQLAAGDTATWKISLADYSAAEGWALSYVFMRHDNGAKITIPSTADGSAHLVNVDAETTKTWVAGNYHGYAYVTKSPDRFKVWKGDLQILPNYSEITDEDPRTIARKTLDAIEAAILKIHTANATGRAGAITEWEAEGLRIKRENQGELLKELLAQRDRYRAIVNVEEAKARRAMGRATGRKHLMKFTRC